MLLRPPYYTTFVVIDQIPALCNCITITNEI
ncbi:hypothetical protein VPHD528_0053 [Vibrio phage D528]